MAEYRTVRQYDLFDCFNADGSLKEQGSSAAEVCSTCRHNIKGVCYFEPDREKRRRMTECQFHSDKLYPKGI